MRLSPWGDWMAMSTTPIKIKPSSGSEGDTHSKSAWPPS